MENNIEKKTKIKIFRLAILVLCIGLCQACSTTVKVINFKDSEYYETEKDGVKFYCLSDYYLQKVLEAKIKKVNP